MCIPPFAAKRKATVSHESSLGEGYTPHIGIAKKIGKIIIMNRNKQENATFE